MTNYETITLSAGVDEAREAIMAGVAGLVAAETGEGTKLRTRRGVQVAVLRPDGDGSTLTFRADPSLSPRGDATRKARHVRDAVAEFEA